MDIALALALGCSCPLPCSTFRFTLDTQNTRPANDIEKQLPISPWVGRNPLLMGRKKEIGNERSLYNGGVIPDFESTNVTTSSHKRKRDWFNWSWLTSSVKRRGKDPNGL